MAADLRKIVTFEAHGRCHRATYKNRRFVLLQDRDGLSLYEQIPLDEPAVDPVAPLKERPVVRSRQRRHRV